MKLLLLRNNILLLQLSRFVMRKVFKVWVACFPRSWNKEHCLEKRLCNVVAKDQESVTFLRRCSYSRELKKQGKTMGKTLKIKQLCMIITTSFFIFYLSSYSVEVLVFTVDYSNSLDRKDEFKKIILLKKRNCKPNLITY